jgi:hypothetical protein
MTIEHCAECQCDACIRRRWCRPFQRDPEGFRARAIRRIRQGRVWLGVKDEVPIFKADIVGDTPEAIYLEGIQVTPERAHERSRQTMSRATFVYAAPPHEIDLPHCQSKESRRVKFYVKAGFDFHSEYQTIYLG